MVHRRSSSSAVSGHSSPPHHAAIAPPQAYWSHSGEAVLTALRSGKDGLSRAAAAYRLRRYGANTVGEAGHPSALRLLVRQFENPLVLILIVAVAIAAVMKDWTNSAIILAIVVGSGLLSFMQEYRASAAVEKLRDKVRVTCRTIRGGRIEVVPSRKVVPGDIVLLSAGNLIPGDGLVLEAKDFFVSQAALTGESYPVEKTPGLIAAAAAVSERTNCVFMGTSVRSGTATVLIVHTGTRTVFGQIADRLRLRPPETEFERSIRRYGYLLMRVMLIVALVVFAINIFLDRPAVDSLLFAIALAVGMSPELLPAIVTITLSHGARRMASSGVIVRRLNAIENLGGMNILCSDKTGTLTQGVLTLDSALDSEGNRSSSVMRHACINAHLQTGMANPLDEAIVAAGQAAKLDISNEKKLDEVPYDFIRKRLSVLVQAPGQGELTLITKGALENVLDVCGRVEVGGRAEPLGAQQRERILQRFAGYSQSGYRVLAVAYKPLPAQQHCTRDDEHDLIFSGYLLFYDPPKPHIRDTLAALLALGIKVKLITGDNPLISAHVAKAVGFDAPKLMTGRELNQLRDEALWHAAEQTDIFAEIDPNQKERIVLALKSRGHVVGYLGDGINDAPALQCADVGISVDQAAEVAKEAADFVLLQNDLDVLRQGVELGRLTYANTFKYIAITTSANFGNMASMAVASLLLPFLPLLPKQILLNNFLSDVPAMAVAGDNVDKDFIDRPRTWDIASLRRFMVAFGSISSVFDFLTFGVLLWLFSADAALFRTGWFVESLMTELLIILIIRTRGPCYSSRPAPLLLWSAVGMMVLTLAIPYSPLAGVFDFVHLPMPVLLAMLGVTAVYGFVSEITKRRIFAGQDAVREPGPPPPESGPPAGR
jgi:Mg2+-importing ATPase